MTPNELDNFVKNLYSDYLLIEQRIIDLNFNDINEYLDYIIDVNGDIILENIDVEIEQITKTIFDKIKNSLHVETIDVVEDMLNGEWMSGLRGTPYANMMNDIYKFLKKSKITERYS